MKRLPKPLPGFLLAVIIAIILHEGAGYVLFDVDTLNVIGHRSQGPLMLITFYVVARAFLYFVAPPLGLYWAVRLFVEAKMRQSAQRETRHAEDRRDNLAS
jgi:hypothetical protein